MLSLTGLAFDSGSFSSAFLGESALVGGGEALTAGGGGDGTFGGEPSTTLAGSGFVSACSSTGVFSGVLGSSGTGALASSALESSSLGGSAGVESGFFVVAGAAGAGAAPG